MEEERIIFNLALLGFALASDYVLLSRACVAL
jgi:hypothetical protein